MASSSALAHGLEASPMSNVSVSSDEDGAAQRTAAAASPSSLPPPVASTAKEQQLIELLSQAASEIRQERAKVRHLEEQLEAQKCAARGPAQGAPMPAIAMRQKLVELSLENFTAVQQVSQLREAVARLEGVVAEQALQMERLRDASGRGRSRNPQSQSQSHPPRKHEDPLSAARPDQRLPPPTHHFDPVASVQRAHSPVRRRAAPTPSNGGGGEEAAERRNYNDVMLSRLRRAIAPPPTKEQLGEVVHAMVKELTRQLARHGAALHMTRLEHCVYQCGKRKLHLAVDSGRLVVKAGGGHVDLLEHIERNKMCVRADVAGR